MAIETLQSKPLRFRAIEVTAPRAVIIAGQVVVKGKQVRIPEPDAYDLVHAGQAKFIDEKPAEPKK